MLHYLYNYFLILGDRFNYFIKNYLTSLKEKITAARKAHLKTKLQIQQK